MCTRKRRATGCYSAWGLIILSFFSSRRRHTRCYRDWSSEVCSSDLIPDREGADLDMDAVLSAAAESGVALEISAHPARLDLSDVHARRAIEMGILLSINTDAHSPPELDLLHFGVATARRAWVEARHVINTWATGRLLSWLRQRRRESFDDYPTRSEGRRV